jgi:hypothetical protein
MTKVKNILFRLNLKGNGIVNFDSSDQKFMFNGTNLNNMKTIHNNTSYAKKRFYKNGEDLEYKLAISSNCLRHAIFVKESEMLTPKLNINDSIFNAYIASPSSILRGYMKTEDKNSDKIGLKRSSCLSITDAIQNCNALSYIEVQTRAGGKKDKNIDEKDVSLFYKETVGEIYYSSYGVIDLMKLQFISADQIFDRCSINPDSFDEYCKFLYFKLPNLNPTLGYYQQVYSDINIGERGFIFSNENIIFLVKFLFERLLTLEIKKANAYAHTFLLEYKLVYDPIEDTLDKEENWVPLTSKEDINNIQFETEFFYYLLEEKNEKEKRESLDVEYLSDKKSKQERKESNKKANKKNEPEV